MAQRTELQLQLVDLQKQIRNNQTQDELARQDIAKRILAVQKREDAVALREQRVSHAERVLDSSDSLLNL